MPCFSAAQVRFTSSANQVKPQNSKNGDRSKSAHQNAVEQTNRSRPSYTPFQTKCERQTLRLNLSGEGDSYGSRFIGNKQRKQNQIKRKEVIIKPKEVQRLKDAAKLVSLEERLNELERIEEASRLQTEQAEQIRLKFKEIDQERIMAVGTQSDDIKLQSMEDKQKVLNHAFLAKQEQEEEVKFVNRIILNAKCSAVRDAQIQEKNLLEREMKRAEQLLEKNCIERALSGLGEQDAEDEKKKVLKKEYARDIRRQLDEREQMRFLEADRITQEAKSMNATNKLLKQEEERQQQMIKDRKHKFHEELDRVVQMSNLFKKMLCEQEREADMRIAAYMRDKQQQERDLKAKKKLETEDFERKQQNLFLRAQKTSESKNKKSAIAFLREQENVEREYRRKEKELAAKKIALQKDLRDTRAQQLEEIRESFAKQIAQAEHDFNNLVTEMKKEEAKQLQLDEARNRRKQCYRRDIVEQMNSKEMERRRLVDLEKARAREWLEKERQRDANIKSVVNAKLDAMREACLPEKYVKEVEQQLKKIEARKKMAL